MPLRSSALVAVLLLGGLDATTESASADGATDYSSLDPNILQDASFARGRLLAVEREKIKSEQAKLQQRLLQLEDEARQLRSVVGFDVSDLTATVDTDFPELAVGTAVGTIQPANKRTSALQERYGILDPDSIVKEAGNEQKTIAWFTHSVSRFIFTEVALPICIGMAVYFLASSAFVERHKGCKGDINDGNGNVEEQPKYTRNVLLLARTAMTKDGAGTWAQRSCTSEQTATPRNAGPSLMSRLLLQPRHNSASSTSDLPLSVLPACQSKAALTFAEVEDALMSRPPPPDVPPPIGPPPGLELFVVKTGTMLPNDDVETRLLSGCAWDTIAFPTSNLSGTSVWQAVPLGDKSGAKDDANKPEDTDSRGATVIDVAGTTETAFHRDATAESATTTRNENSGKSEPETDAPAKPQDRRPQFDSIPQRQRQRPQKKSTSTLNEDHSMSSTTTLASAPGRFWQAFCKFRNAAILDDEDFMEPLPLNHNARAQKQKRPATRKSVPNPKAEVRCHDGWRLLKAFRCCMHPSVWEAFAPVISVILVVVLLGKPPGIPKSLFSNEPKKSKCWNRPIPVWLNTTLDPKGVPITEFNLPTITLYAPCLRSAFVDFAMHYTASANYWYYIQARGAPYIALKHHNEDPFTINQGMDCASCIAEHLGQKSLPKVGRLSSFSSDFYSIQGKGMVIGLFSPEIEVDMVDTIYRRELMDLADRIKNQYFVTYMNTNDMSDRTWIASEFGVTSFPVFVVINDYPGGEAFIHHWKSFPKLLQFIEDVTDGCIGYKPQRVFKKKSGMDWPKCDADAVWTRFVGTR
mmetsp:Transcript_1615/g.3695  ORF Transcript_1615/g.3695 Transcript_1615/m.3695 type:complete len:807 (-) Transcript_1615:168-2588(-)